MFLNPYKAIQLVGKWAVQAVTLQLPRSAVEFMVSSDPYLGPHLRLARQSLTVDGTHPVIFLFGTHYRARLTFPWFFPPPMTYDEMVVMVPYVSPWGELAGAGLRGPMVYMPRLFLSQLLPTFGGWFFWGFNKKLSRIEYGMNQQGGKNGGVVHGSYGVRGLAMGAPLLSLKWNAGESEEWIPVNDAPFFNEARELHEQPLLGQIPGTVGPVLGYAYWRKFWDQGMVRPISHAKVDVDAPFIAGLDMGQYTSKPISGAEPLGAYQLRVPWALELPRIEKLVSSARALKGAEGGWEPGAVESWPVPLTKRGTAGEDTEGVTYLDDRYPKS